MFSPAAFLDAIRRHRVGATVTVPTMLIATVSDPSFASADISSLKVLMYGAAPMAVEWIDRVAMAFPDVALLNCYGLTETSPDLTVFDAREFRAAIDRARATGDRSGSLTSVGKPNVLNELRVVDREGREVPRGEIGEIVARGPNIMKGYLNMPNETESALRDGWLHTGDIGRIDEAGYVYLVDRLKDVVMTGGENVYSSEVEAVLFRHPAVAEAAIIGVPHERLGETVMAVIVPKAGARPTEEELIVHCRASLGGFKVPRRFAFVEALPKSALGKVLKEPLRKQFAEP
jgi:long-chain acyl-CoA synthetase